MSARRILLLPIALCGAMILSCSKQSSEPTAPREQGPVCSLSAEALYYDRVEVGTSFDGNLQVTNAGGGTLSGTVVDPSADFLLVGRHSYSLTAGQSDTLTVRFLPLSVGDKSAVLQVGVGCTTRLSGIGVAPVILDCGLSSTSIDFGTVSIGQIVDRTFTLTNNSTSSMTGTLIDTSAVFTVPGSSSYNLSPGQKRHLHRPLHLEPGGAERVRHPDRPARLPGGHLQRNGAGGLCRLDLSGRLFSYCSYFAIVGPTGYGLSAGQSATFTLQFTPIQMGPHQCVVAASGGCSTTIVKGVGQ